VNLLQIIFRTILKLDIATTFADLRNSEIKFRCWATDLTMRTSREFSLKETPGARIIDALRATTAIPMYFIPHIDPLTGNMLSDGGIQGNLPLHYLTEDECSETLAIGFTTSSETSTPQDLIQFMKAVFDCMVISRNEDIMERWKHHIMRISTGNYPSWNFEASREDRVMLLNKGYDGAKAWLDQPPCRKILRRNSS